MSDYLPSTKGSYRIYVLVVLAISNLFGFMDRQIMAILIEDIGAEYALSDTHRGILLGLAFALFYALLGIPIARLADLWNRKNIIAISVALWSIATALSGASTGFWTLFVTRVGVGVGEAGGTPPSHSIISDYFRKLELTRALSIYSLGTIFGGALGLALGGLFSELYGWRIAFVVVGLPGVLLGLIIYLTVREPKRGHFDSDYVQGDSQIPLWINIRMLWVNRPYVGALSAYVTASVVGLVVISWVPAIMARNYGLGKPEIGLYFGAALLIGGTLGLLAGGAVSDYLARRDVRWLGWVPAIACLLFMPLSQWALFHENVLISTFIVSGAIFFFTVTMAPGLSIVQQCVRPDQRALAASFVYFFSSLFATGVGPTLAGWLSDYFQPVYGLRSLTYAVSLVCLLIVPAAITFYWTGNQLRRRS